MNLTVVRAGNKKPMNGVPSMENIEKLIAEEFKMQEGYKIIDE